MLPKYHKLMGHEVAIIASLFTFDENGKGTYLPGESSYINEHGIRVHRIDYKNFIKPLQRLIRNYNNTYALIEKETPDIIFIHGCQFCDIKQVVRYAKNNPSVRVYVDNHADFSNSASNWFSKNILHKTIWRRSAHKIEPFTIKFYGVLPARVEFLKKMYKLPEEKVELLVMGADDEKVAEAKNEMVKSNIRGRHNIKPDDFLIVTGGKIDAAKKQTLMLMEAVKQIDRENVKLIIFGSIIDELKEEFNALCDNVKTQYIGWIDAEDSYKYFSAAELVVFPGRHSVFWEQAAGLGIPLVVKYWDGTTHVDLHGNCRFLYKDTVAEITEVLCDLLDNPHVYQEMKKISSEKGMKAFSYQQIARYSINEC
jgi:glycosyltransferase involved in cell wall biosynthesis